MFLKAKFWSAAVLVLCALLGITRSAQGRQCDGNRGRDFRNQNNNLTISTTALAFGVYDPTNTTAATSTISIIAQCNKSSDTLPPLSIAINAGDSGSFSTRHMNGTGSAAGATLNYQLFSNVSDTTIWGDGTGGTTTVSGGAGSSYSQIFVGYGVMPTGQYTTAGSYSDTLIVTVTY